MRFELVGISPVSKYGEYFENNVWWWPRLWDFVYYLCDDILTKEQHIGVMLTRNIKISGEVSQMLAKRLFESLENRERYQYFIDEYVGPCEYAQIFEQRGKGINVQSHTEPGELRFRFSWDNVNKFALFCRDSGGFVIC